MHEKRSFSRIYPIQPFFIHNASIRYLKNTMNDSPVAHFYTYRTGEESIKSLVIPDGCIDIVFVCDAVRPHAWICGPVTEYREINTTPDTIHFGIRCRPGILPRIFGVAWPELLNNKLLLSDVAGKYKQLPERIAYARNFRERIDVFTEICLSDIEQWSYPGYGLFGSALDLIFQRNGLLTVGDISKNLHYTTRYIDKVFRNYIGMTPKQYCRTIRFQTLLKSIMPRQPCHIPKLTERALEMGYYDHSHMLRDFRFFTSMNPSEYLKTVTSPSYFNKVYELAREFSIRWL